MNLQPKYRVATQITLNKSAQFPSYTQNCGWKTKILSLKRGPTRRVMHKTSLNMYPISHTFRLNSRWQIKKQRIKLWPTYRVILHATLQIERSGRRRGLRREVMKLKIERISRLLHSGNPKLPFSDARIAVKLLLQLCMIFHLCFVVLLDFAVSFI